MLIAGEKKLHLPMNYAKWFAHDPAKWNGFIKKYKEEIEQNPAKEELLNLVNEHDRVMLLYSAKEENP